ncbi:Uncharacterised protein [BD1-7 clade bacterium]|uniref:Uncharacterized protein n=1 Tax=BD1-7 clade bacterium TaxID=2029982 RepID=A0A5S9QP37_9GAMM|nr:Uncharacterised protein [BD1-7 clade bacterium]
MTLRMSHQYDVAADMFVFDVSGQTLKKLKNHGLMLRHDGDALHILYEGILVDDVLQPLKPITSDVAKDLSLQIYIRAKNPKLFLVSEHIPEPGKSIFYFSNKDVVIRTSPSASVGDIHLTSNTSGYTAEQGDISMLHPQRLDLAAQSGEPAVLSLTSALSKACIYELIKPVGGLLKVNADFSQFGPGLFSLEFNDETREFFASDELLRNSAFAVVELFMNVDVDEAVRIVAVDGGVTEREYRIEFSSRSTIWRYFVVPRHTAIPDATQISIQSDNHTFSPAMTTQLPSEEPAFVIQSIAPIPLRALGEKNIALKKSMGPVKDLVRHLPCPTPAALTNESETDYSDMYVYV